MGNAVDGGVVGSVLEVEMMSGIVEDVVVGSHGDAQVIKYKVGNGNKEGGMLTRRRRRSRWIMYRAF